MNNAQEPKPRRKRPGPAKRKRSMTFPVRMSAEERAAIEASAEREGLSLGGYIRSRALAMPTTRAHRRPPVDILVLLRLQGDLNKVGGNIHQLLRHVNFGRLIDPHDEIRVAFLGYREVIAAIMAVLHRPYGTPQSEPDGSDGGEELP
jgi:hypothetical protein